MSWELARRLAWTWQRNPAYCTGRGSRRRYALEQRVERARARLRALAVQSLAHRRASRQAARHGVALRALALEPPGLRVKDRVYLPVSEWHAARAYLRQAKRLVLELMAPARAERDHRQMALLKAWRTLAGLEHSWKPETRLIIPPMADRHPPPTRRPPLGNDDWKVVAQRCLAKFVASLPPEEQARSREEFAKLGYRV